MKSYDVDLIVHSYDHFARFCGMSYKKTHGYILFGEDWQLVHNLNLESMGLRYEESTLLKKILHIEQRLSIEEDFDRQVDYKLILDDLRARLRVLFKDHKELNTLITDTLDTLLKKKGIASLVVT